jgi:RNA polymerase sigma factor (sigma-70 family)
MQPQTELTDCDDTALADLYQRHVYALLNFIRRYVQTREDAEDVLLEVFMAALERHALVSLSDGEQLAWLRRVAHHKCVDVYRHAQRHPAVSLEGIADSLYADEEQSPEQVVLHTEEHALLRSHLANLSEQQQAVLYLRFGHGLRTPEIAMRLNKGESAVRMLLSRTLNLLRGIYEKREKGEREDE